MFNSSDVSLSNEDEGNEDEDEKFLLEENDKEENDNENDENDNDNDGKHHGNQNRNSMPLLGAEISDIEFEFSDSGFSDLQRRTTTEKIRKKQTPWNFFLETGVLLKIFFGTGVLVTNSENTPHRFKISNSTHPQSGVCCVCGGEPAHILKIINISSYVGRVDPGNN